MKYGPMSLRLFAVFSAADQSRDGDTITVCQNLCIYDFQPKAHQNNIIFLMAAFDLSTLSVTSEENGRHVNMVNAAVMTTTAYQTWHTATKAATA